MPGDVSIDTKSLRVFWRRVWPFIRAHRGAYSLGIVFELLAIGAAVVYPQMFRLVVDEGIQNGDMSQLGFWMMVMAGVLLVQSIAILVRSYLLELAAQRVSAEVRNWVFERVVSQEMAFFDENNTGDLTSRLHNDTHQLSGLLRNVAPELIHFALTGVAGAAMMIYTSPQLSAVVFIAGPMIWYGSSFLGKYLRGQSVVLQDRFSQLVREGMETLRGIQTVRVYNREQAAVQRYVDEGEELIEAAKGNARATAFLLSFTNFFSEGAVLLALGVGGMLIAQQSLTPGSLISFVLYAVMLMRGTRNVAHAGAEVLRAQGATEKIFLIGERESALDMVGGLVPDECRGDVRLEDVHFAYPSRPDTAALHGVSLDIPRGEVLAFVGASGSGKSTVTKLIARLYDPDSGRVLLDGHDLRELDNSWLREQITLVPAEAMIFAASLADNIRYGRPEASDLDVREAAAVSHAAGFIESLPKGYDTDSGDAGRLFSSGQRQRVAIARAILRGPKVLILDEATAALDAQGEGIVKESLRKLPSRPTLIVVSHRLSTIIDADRVIMIKDGLVVAQGTHAELMASSSDYRDLVENQLIRE